MQAEEAVGDLPGGEQGFAGFEEGRDPSGSDMCIEGLKHVIDHPEDGLAALGLAEMITVTGAVHLVDGQFPGGDERMKKIEVISTTGFHHRHRGQHEGRCMMEEGRWMMAESFEGVAENVVPFHKSRAGYN